MRNVSCIHSEIANNKFTFIASRKRKNFFFSLFFPPFSRRKMIIFELRRKKGKQIKFWEVLMEKINLKNFFFKHLGKAENEKFVNKFFEGLVYDSFHVCHFASKTFYGAFYR